MRRKRRLRKPEFNFDVALTAIKGEMSMAEMVQRFDVQAAQITQLKEQLLSAAEVTFENGDHTNDNHEQEILLAKTGWLAMENGLLEQALEGKHGSRGKKW